MNLQCCRNSVPFPGSVPLYNPDLDNYRQFLWLHGLVCALMCTVNCGTLYRQVCVPFQIMSSKLNIPQLDSNQLVETSQGWSVKTSCTRAQFWVFECMTCVLLFFPNFYFVIMGYCLWNFEENNTIWKGCSIKMWKKWSTVNTFEFVSWIHWTCSEDEWV